MGTYHCQLVIGWLYMVFTLIITLIGSAPTLGTLFVCNLEPICKSLLCLIALIDCNPRFLYLFYDFSTKFWLLWICNPMPRPLKLMAFYTFSTKLFLDSRVPLRFHIVVMSRLSWLVASTHSMSHEAIPSISFINQIGTFQGGHHLQLVARPPPTLILRSFYWH